MTLGFRASVSDVALERVDVEQTRPERQGLFGFLSIGFAAAALLTVLGFSLYALFSFRRRFIELGMLRAIGLSSAQMTHAPGLLSWRSSSWRALCWARFWALPPAASSSRSCRWAPGRRRASRRIWCPSPGLSIIRIWMLFGLLFVGVLSVLAVLLLRMRIFQAVKLGETA